VRLKKLLAETELEKAILKDLGEGNLLVGAQAQGCPCLKGALPGIRVQVLPSGGPAAQYTALSGEVRLYCGVQVAASSLQDRPRPHPHGRAYGLPLALAGR
jgi:hypothetical protein